MNHSATQERIDAEIKIVGHSEKKGVLVRAQNNSCLLATFTQGFAGSASISS